MWIKALGVVFVWIGCIGIGDCMIRNLRKRMESLMDLRKKLGLLRGDVAYAGATLPESIERITRLSGEQEGFFLQLKELLEQEDGEAFSQKWKKAVESSCGTLALTKNDEAELLRLGQFLGQQDKESQLYQLDWYLKLSEENLAEIRKGEREKIRLYRMLSILGGAFLCIILL